MLTMVQAIPMEAVLERTSPHPKKLIVFLQADYL